METIEIPQCECGCGQNVNFAPNGNPRRFRQGHNRLGVGMGWPECGYWNFSIGGKRVRAHRHIWMQQFGPIPNGMVVHHINEDKMDNRIENLALMANGEHCRLHREGKPGRSFTQEEMMKAVNLYREGYTIQEAAQYTGVPYDALRRWVSSLGLSRSAHHSRRLKLERISRNESPDERDHHSGLRE